MRFTDADGAWYLLGKRHRKLGGTWANIGGSLKRGEDSFTGALREFEEEVGISPSRLIGATVTEVIDCGDAGVPYQLFVLEVPVCFEDARLSWEHTSLYWWHTSEVCNLQLHRGFRRAWGLLHGLRGRRVLTLENGTQL